MSRAERRAMAQGQGRGRPEVYFQGKQRVRRNKANRLATQTVQPEEVHTLGPRPSTLKLRRNYLIAGVGIGAGGAAYIAHRRRRNAMGPVYKLYDPFSGETVTVEKADRYSSGGRTATAALAPGVHGAIAGRKGKKLRAAGKELAGASLLGIPGLVIAGPRLAAPGAVVGSALGHRSNLRHGYLQPLEKADRFNTTSGTHVRFLPARTPQGRFVSHANQLKIAHPDRPKERGVRHPRAQLVQVKRGPRSRSGSSVGKGLAYARLNPSGYRRALTAQSQTSPRLKELYNARRAQVEGGQPPRTMAFSGRPRRGRKLTNAA